MNGLMGVFCCVLLCSAVFRWAPLVLVSDLSVPRFLQYFILTFLCVLVHQELSLWLGVCNCGLNLVGFVSL